MGSRLLTWLAPEGKNCESAKVPVDNDFEAEIPIHTDITHRYGFKMRPERNFQLLLSGK